MCIANKDVGRKRFEAEVTVMEHHILIRTFLAGLLAVIAALPAHGAELTRHHAPADDTSEGARLLQIEGDLFIAPQFSGPSQRLRRVTAEGFVTADSIELPRHIKSYAPFRDGLVAARFATGNGHEAAIFEAIVVGRQSSDRPKVLYRTQTRVEDLQLAPSLAQDAVYVAASRRNQFAVHRVDSAGAVHWSRNFGDAVLIETLAIPGGVALIHYPQPANPPVKLPVQIVALADDGRELWQMSYARPPNLSAEKFAFQPPHHLVALQIPSGLDAGWTLFRVDVRDGADLGAIPVPPASHVRPTSLGLLLYDNLAGQPYVALVREDGSLAWWRRYALHEKYGGWLNDVAIGTDGHLLMTGVHEANPNGAGERGRTFLVTDARNPARTPHCLDVDPAEIVPLQRSLEWRHAIDVRVSGAMFPSTSRPCTPPTDRAYLSFLHALDAALGWNARHEGRWDLRIRLHVRDVEVPYSLQYYDSNTGVADAPRVSLSYVVSPNAAVDVQQHLVKIVWPHLRSMERIQQGFYELTGSQLGIRLRQPALPDAQLFERLEATGATVIAAVETIPSEQLSAASALRSNRYPRMNVDAFGNHDDLRPLSDVHATVRKVLGIDE